jgi:uncharacterized protein with NAD-binding domain and iron-sulfur cluster
MQKVIVLGGGVGGLTAAHELIERGYQVEVYERRPDHWGGKARSMGSPGTGVGGRLPLPGEHGFRFFPGFYQHLPDTMKRIPAATRTVFDNLVKTTQIEMTRENGTPILTPAGCPDTWESWLQALWELAHIHPGIPRAETEFFAGRLFQVLSSCQERRLGEYEGIPWWNFIDADNKSEAYQKLLGEGLTRSLVAMQAQIASTRTVGDILVQLLFNSITPGVAADRVLNAPTNDAWLRWWIEYLTQKGVTLVQDAEVRGFVMNGATIAGVTLEIGGQPVTVTGDYYVSALPCEVMTRLVTADMAALSPSLARIQNLKTRWMNGIQFYLKGDVPVDHGHCIYLDSTWALTSISQHQFWTSTYLALYGDGEITGVLSVDISDWTAPGNKVVLKAADDCTAEEIQAEVWAQMKAHLNRNGEMALPDQPAGWHLDPDIVFPRTSALNDGNQEPLLVNVTDSWQYRPEAAIEIPNLFLASDYVRTYTDLATMEGANEAARRAVNGILTASGSSQTPCQLWPLHEPLIFAPFRFRDELRYKAGQPWSHPWPFN